MRRAQSTANFAPTGLCRRSSTRDAWFASLEVRRKLRVGQDLGILHDQRVLSSVDCWHLIARPASPPGPSPTDWTRPVRWTFPQDFVEHHPNARRRRSSYAQDLKYSYVRDFEQGGPED